MNNKPVAWMFEKDGAYMCIKHDNRVNYDGGIPLYTHPVNPYQSITNTKIEPTVVSYTHPVELTDEEIWDFINALCLDMGDYWELTERNAIPMIRAILRKAQQ